MIGRRLRLAQPLPGIYGHQYTPNYSAAITELLTRAGYEGSAQVENAMRWLLAMRQDDGGWAIPTRTLGMSLNVMLTARETFEPDRSRRSSHLVTGIVVRAFAAHPGYRHSADTRRAADLLEGPSPRCLPARSRGERRCSSGRHNGLATRARVLRRTRNNQGDTDSG